MTLALLFAALTIAGPGDPAAIRAARARFNRAIANHDQAHLADDWTDDLRVITSRGRLTTDRAGYLQGWADHFAERPDVRYDRRPERIEIQDAWGTASETGTWTGAFTDADGPVRLSGRYLAQWRRTPAGWKLSAEAFVALTCSGGAYCRGTP